MLFFYRGVVLQMVVVAPVWYKTTILSGGWERTHRPAENH